MYRAIPCRAVSCPIHAVPEPGVVMPLLTGGLHSCIAFFCDTLLQHQSYVLLVGWFACNCAHKKHSLSSTAPHALGTTPRKSLRLPTPISSRQRASWFLRRGRTSVTSPSQSSTAASLSQKQVIFLNSHTQKPRQHEVRNTEMQRQEPCS